MTKAADIFKRPAQQLIPGVRDCPVCHEALAQHLCRQQDAEYFTCWHCSARYVLGPSGWFAWKPTGRPKFICGRPVEFRRTVADGVTQDGQAFAVKTPAPERKRE